MKSSLHITACCLLVFWWAMFERLPFEPATPAGVVTAVVHACQESRLRDLVPLAAALRGKPLGVVATTLAKQLVLCTADGLCMRRPPKALWKVLLVCFMLCSSWIYPEKSQWKRTNVHVETLWAACAVCRSLLWLSGCKRRRWAYKAGLLLEDWHRQALWREDRPKHWTKVDVRRAVDSLVSLQLAAVLPQLDVCGLFGVSQDMGAVLYCWVAPCAYYVGMAGLRRQCRSLHCGVARRWLEHGALLLRTHCRDSRRLRYKAMRQVNFAQSFFLVCRVDTRVRISAMEQWEIRTRRPNANVPSSLPRKQGCCPCSPPRRRPPKHCRRQLQAQGPFNHFRFPHETPTPHASQVDRPSDFHSLYAFLVRLRVVAVGLHGPLDLYAPCNSRLLATWCGTKHAVVDWQLLERKWSSGCGPAAIVPAIGFVQGKGRKALATRRVNAALRARALPPVSGITCRVPQCLLPVVKQSVRFAVSICSMPWNDHERAWALSRVRFVISAPSKFKDQWNAPKISKSFQVSLIASNFSIKDDIVGMHRVDKVWDLPVRLSQPESVHLAAECAATCCSALGSCDVDASIAAASCARGLASCPEYNKERRRCIASDTEYQLYTSNMFRGKNEVLVPDDKLKKYMWLIPLWAYQHLLWHFALVARTWHLSCLSVACANTWCWNVLNCLLSERLKKFLHFHKYKHVLPYMYGTIKSKCFVGGVHSCCKVGHSCIRKIVSCAAWPCRKRWKYIHKALETVVRSVIMSDEIWGLKDVCIVMQSRIAKASIGSTRLNACGRCSCCKPPVVAFSADAGQFFETVSPSAAVRVTKKVLERAAEISGRNSVTVLRGPKRQAFIGGSVARVDPSSYCFLFSGLLLAFAACMFVGFCRLGDICFRMDGLPIGGLLSKIAASIFLGCEEESWSHNVAWRRQNGFTATSPSWDKEVARGRYVDDIFWVSAVYCKPCLLRALQLIYSVEFDLASEGPVVDWLDIAFHVPNLKWSMIQKAWVFPPYWAAPRGFLRSFLCGRFHRWYEIILDDVAWFDAVAHVLSCLHQQSWPASTVRAAIFQSRHVLKPRHQRWLLRCFRGIWLPRNAKAQY